MSGTPQSIRYAVRQLLKAPGFTAVAVLTLALGIGANTTVFSVVRGVLLRPLPFTDPDQLVQIDMVHAESGLIAKGTSFLNFEDWRSQNDVFREMAAVQDTTLTLTGDGEAEQIHAWGVSARFFPLLGVQPVQGRVFEDDNEMRDPVAVVSHRLWQTRFGAQPAILDKHMTLDGRSYAVIGVMPASFNLPGDATDVWIPLGSAFIEGSRRNQHLFTLAILKRGVSLGQAQSAMDVIAQRLARQFPDDNAGWGVRLHPLHGAIAGKLRPALLILFGCVGLVFLIVCLNIANLVLARGAARNREIAIRVALGASRFQVVRQFMIESLLLSLFGGALGLLLAAWGLRLLRAIPSSSAGPILTGMETVPSDAARVDGAVLIFLLLASIAASVLLGLIPALRSSRPHPNQALKEGGHGADRSGRGHDRVRDSVVVVQIAAALVLLVGAGLLIGSFARLMRVNPGFRPDSVLCAEIALARSSYPEVSQVAAFWDQLREKVAAVPGVDSVGAVNLPPFGTNNMARFSIQGRVPRAPGQFDYGQLPRRRLRATFTPWASRYCKADPSPKKIAPTLRARW